MVTALAAERVGEATDSEIIHASWQSPDRFGALYDRYATVLYGFALLAGWAGLRGRRGCGHVPRRLRAAAHLRPHPVQCAPVAGDLKVARSTPRAARAMSCGPGRWLRWLVRIRRRGPHSPRGGARSARLVAAGIAVVAAGAFLLTAPGDVTDAGDGGPVAVQPAAFTLHVNTDGSVTFTAHDVIDTTAATVALNGAGISGRVINDQTAGCPTKSDDIQPGDLYPDNTLSRGPGTNDTVTLRSSDYPVGGGLLVVVTSRGGESGRAVPPDPVSVAIFAFDDAGKVPDVRRLRGPRDRHALARRVPHEAPRLANGSLSTHVRDGRRQHAVR